MLNLKELLIKKVKNYKIGDIDSKDADRLRKGMIAFIKNNSVEKIDEALDIYLNKLYELCEINDFEGVTTITQITSSFKALKPYIDKNVNDIFNAQTSLEINQYEQQEPFFVSFIVSIYNIVNIEDDNYKTELINDLTFFIEEVLETIEEETDE